MSAHDHPPELPEVTDEAGNSPRWVPYLGAALFVLMVAYIWWGHRHPDALAEDSAQVDPGAAQVDPGAAH